MLQHHGHIYGPILDFARVFKVAVTKNISTVYAKFAAVQNVKESTVNMVIFSGFDFYGKWRSI